MGAGLEGPYDWFIVTQGDSDGAINPTWPGVAPGTAVQAANEAAAIVAGAIGTSGKAILLRSITILQNHDAAGVITLFHGDGTTAYFSLVIGSNNNSPGHTLDILLADGLSVKDGETTPAGSILLAYSPLP